ncbi:MAG TPA: hypothetical protein VE422_50450 [Terriglobia bacterium]|nr:hypothetical protein [Terriglobia bacterium]
MPKCALHPGRDSVTIVFGKNYCQTCRDGIAAARNRVDRHVEPKDCFIWYVSNDNWQPITGTGCAHWVSHQMNIQAGRAGDCCFSGFTYRVPVLVHSRIPVPNISQVRVNDIWLRRRWITPGSSFALLPQPGPMGAPRSRFDMTPAGKVELRKTISPLISTVKALSTAEEKGG